MSEFSLGAIMADEGFYCDTSLPFCVKPSSGCLGESGPFKYGRSVNGQFIDCRIPESYRAKIVKGEADNLSYSDYLEVEI